MKIDRSKLRKTQSDVVSLGENDLPLNFDSETTCMHPLKSSQSQDNTKCMPEAGEDVAQLLIILMFCCYKCNIDKVFSQAPECRQLIQRLKEASDGELIRILKDINTWYYGKV